ncbi:MAG: hypothetical protein ACE5JG_04615, partial [Planctomycetota bacterium]
LTVERSTIGEAIAFMRSRMEIRDTTCDGTGGYVSTHDTAQIRLVGCTIRSPVVARDRSTAVLERCTVHGDVRATGSATIRLVDCTVTGKVEQDPGAWIHRE